MEISSHHSRLLLQLNEQRRQDLFCDCHILVEGKSFKAHRNVLFASSGYFKMLLSQNSRVASERTTATFEVFSSETFHIILDFVYTGKLSLNCQSVIEVMSAASYLQMTDVISACKKFINSSLDINEKGSDCLSTLPDQDKSSSVDRRSSLCTATRRAGSSPTLPQPAPGQGELTVTSSSWHHYGGQLPSQTGIQQQQPYVDEELRKGISLRRSRQLAALSHSADVAGYNSRIHVDSPGSSRAQPQMYQVSPIGAVIQIEDEESLESNCRQSQEVKSELVSHEEPESLKPIHLTKTDPYAGFPPIVGVVEGYGEDGLPRMRFKCPYCTHTVKRKADLKRHLRSHTGERPFPCPACGKGFTRLEHLRGHFQTIHEACKLVCRKCKFSVTEETGRVVQQGTRRYRLCHRCLADSASDIIPVEQNEGQSLSFTVNDKVTQWLLGQDHSAEPRMPEYDGISDVIIHEVGDSDEDIEETKM